MPIYQYYTVPILPGTGTGVVVELELSGVSMDKQLNGAGNFQGTYRLNSDTDVLNNNVLGGTVPGYHAMICKRNGIPIWGGPIWSRSYESEGQTIGLTAQTFESVFPRVPLSVDFIKSAVLQTTIIDDLLTVIQGGIVYNFGFVTSHNSVVGLPTRSMAIAGYEYKSADDVLSQLLDGDDGLVYTINLTGTGDTPTKTLQTYSNLVSPPASGLALDYPGTLSQYWFTESGAKGAVRHVATASGTAIAVTDSNMAVQPSGSGYPTSGWPRFYEQQSYLDVSDLGALQAKADRQAILLKNPTVEPIFELTDAAAEVFTSWNDLGKTAVFNVQDVRFPTSISFTTQLQGWSLTPESSDGPETIRLQSVSDQ